MTYRESLERAITAYSEAKEAAVQARDYDGAAMLRQYIEGLKEKLRKTAPGAGSIIADRPDCDGTDAAHPAFWRGHDHAIKTACQMLNEIMDGRAEPAGVSSEPWESTRRRLYALVHKDRDDRNLEIPT